jgi:dTDP-4-dehydrorhamnose reductase
MQSQNNAAHTPSRILIVGPHGVLGQRLVEILSRETNWDIMLATRSHLLGSNQQQEIDTSKPKEWMKYLSEEIWRPDVIINSAAYTNVDGAETERETAWRTNVSLVESLARAAKSVDAKLIQISTDYIFDGEDGPYSEESTPNPINYYGRTKLAAENVCHRANIEYLIARTMWLYGPNNGTKPTFLDWVVRELRSKKQISVVTDEYGTATLTDDIAFALIRSIERKVTGTINLSGPLVQSRMELAQDIATMYNLDAELINPTTTANFNRAARRPLRSGLINLKAQTVLSMQPSSPREGIAYTKTTGERHQQINM